MKIKCSDLTFKKKYYDTLVLIVISLFIISKYSGEFIPIPIIPLLILFIGLALFQKVIYPFPIIRDINWEHIAWFSFLLLMLFSYLWTRSTVYGYRKMYLLFPMLLIPGLWGVYWAQSFRKFRIVYFSIYSIALVYLVLFKGKEIIQSYLAGYAGRLSLQGEDTENSAVLGLGTFFAYGIVLGLSFLKFSFSRNLISFIKRNLKAIFLLAIIVSSAVFMLLTGSRGPMVALIGSFVVFLFTKYINRVRFLFINFVFVILYVITQLGSLLEYLISISPGGIKSILERRFTAVESDASLLNRFKHYFDTIDAIIDGSFFNQLFGFGIGDWGYFYLGDKASRAYPHNFFIEVWYELGIVGLVLFCLCCLKVLLINIKIRGVQIKEMNWIILSFYFFLFRAQSSGDIPSNFPIFVFFLLVIKAEKYYRPIINKQKGKIVGIS